MSTEIGPFLKRSGQLPFLISENCTGDDAPVLIRYYLWTHLESPCAAQPHWFPVYEVCIWMTMDDFNENGQVGNAAMLRKTVGDEGEHVPQAALTPDYLVVWMVWCVLILLCVACLASSSSCPSISDMWNSATYRALSMILGIGLISVPSSCSILCNANLKTQRKSLGYRVGDYLIWNILLSTTAGQGTVNSMPGCGVIMAYYRQVCSYIVIIPLRLTMQDLSQDDVFIHLFNKKSTGSDVENKTKLTIQRHLTFLHHIPTAIWNFVL